MTRQDPVTIRSKTPAGVSNYWTFAPIIATYECDEKKQKTLSEFLLERNPENQDDLIKTMLDMDTARFLAASEGPTAHYHLPTVMSLNTTYSTIHNNRQQILEGVTTITLEDGPLMGYTFLITKLLKDKKRCKAVDCEVKAIYRTVMLESA